MPSPKHIRPGEKVGLKFSAAERKLILDDVMCLDDEYADAIRQTPANQPVELTLDEWDDLGGYIAAEANHTEDKKLRKKLDAIFNKVQKILDAHTDEEPPKIVKLRDARKGKKALDHWAQISRCVAEALMAAEETKDEPLQHFSLSPAQREVLLLVPGIPKAIESKLTDKKASFTVADVANMTTALAKELPDAEGPKQMALLLVAKHLLERLLEGITTRAKPKDNKGKKPRAKAPSTTAYQFKITLKDIDPPIWRRIQTKDCTLDKLHEHIQTAMGWTNSHLHQFKIGGVLHGDPELIYEGWEDEEPPVNSRRLKISKIIPTGGKRFSFDYEYDFGDGWEHEILFEGFVPAEKGVRYPLCIEGERACPPEDVGGLYGYEEYVKAMANPRHKRHKEFLEWSGPYDFEKFDAQAATAEMQKGLPNWREME